MKSLVLLVALVLSGCATRSPIRTVYLTNPPTSCPESRWEFEVRIWNDAHTRSYILALCVHVPSLEEFEAATKAFQDGVDGSTLVELIDESKWPAHATSFNAEPR